MITRKDGAVFDAYQESVLDRIEARNPEIPLLATRGHSTPQEQLHIIGAYSQGFQFPEFNPQDVYATCTVELFGLAVHGYCWLRTWGECLRRGFIINPPLQARAPFDYIRDGVNKKGQLIHASPHIVDPDLDPSIRSCPIDFSQMVGSNPNIDLVERIMMDAKESGIPIKNVTVEHGNGCVHIDLEKRVKS
jgi:hypothetical protein